MSVSNTQCAHKHADTRVTTHTLLRSVCFKRVRRLGRLCARSFLRPYVTRTSSPTSASFLCPRKGSFARRAWYSYSIRFVYLASVSLFGVPVILSSRWHGEEGQVSRSRVLRCKFSRHQQRHHAALIDGLAVCVIAMLQCPTAVEVVYTDIDISVFSTAAVTRPATASRVQPMR